MTEMSAPCRAVSTAILGLIGFNGLFLIANEMFMLIGEDHLGQA
jgi:hypothetical protein